MDYQRLSVRASLPRENECGRFIGGAMLIVRWITVTPSIFSSEARVAGSSICGRGDNRVARHPRAVGRT